MVATPAVDFLVRSGIAHRLHEYVHDPAAAERATGYVVGGISPFGQKRRLSTIVDESASGWPTVFVNGGRRGLELELELAPADLVALTGASLAPIARAPKRRSRHTDARQGRSLRDREDP